MWKKLLNTHEQKYLALEILRYLKKILPNDCIDLIEDEILAVVDIDII